MAANGLCSVVCFDHGLLLTFPTGFQTQADLLRSVWGMNTFFLLLLAPMWLCQAQDMPTSARFSGAFVSSSVCFLEMFTMEGTVWSGRDLGTWGYHLA